MNDTKTHNVAFAWFGIFAVAVFAITWICAAALDSTWVFGEDMISKLGISNTDASLYFKYGCILTGAFAMIFGIGNTLYAKNAGHASGGIFMIMAGLFLALVGIITMDVGNGNLHNFVAITMAIFILCAAISFAAGNWYEHHELYAGVPIIIICIIIGLSIGYNNATAEGWAVILALLWICVESIRMIATTEKD